MESQDNILIDFYKDKSETTNNKEEDLKRIEQLKSVDYIQTEEEKQLYEKFCQIANEDPDQKFKFEHIDKLGVKADFVIIYGKKGIGKTYQISKIISDLSERDENAEVILLRNTVSEFQALQKQLLVDYSPIYLKGRTTNNPSLFHKHLLRGKKPRYMGFCAALNGFSLESAKSAEYPNIRLIIWDECTNVGTSTTYDSGDIARFITFFDSIIRNKTNVKIYIFGNFHRQTSGKVSDVLLDTLRIPYGCTLKHKIVESHNKKNKSSFLYINTGSLYSGVDTNAKVSLFSEQIQEDLYGNMPKSYSSMVGALNIFYSHIPEWGLIFNNGIDTYILLLSSFSAKKDKNHKELNWMIHMEKFPTDNVFVHDILTSSMALYNAYSKDYGVELISSEEERLYIHELYEICLQRSLYYSCDIALELFKCQMNYWQEKYNLGITVSFFPTKNKQWKGF